MEVHSPEFLYEEKSEGLMSAFSWEKRDNRTDSLPMMTTIAWPFGIGIINAICVFTIGIKAANLDEARLILGQGSECHRSATPSKEWDDWIVNCSCRSKVNNLFLLLHNIVKCVMLIIVIHMICSDFWQRVMGEAQQDLGIMMAHYIQFLGTAKKCIFFFMEGILDGWSDRRNHVDYGTQEKGFHLRLIMKSTLQLQLPLMTWVFVKYQYHFACSLLIGATINLLSPFAYFYSLTKPGNKNDFSTLRHWHETLSILNSLSILVQIVYMMATTNQDVTLYLAMFIIFATSVFVWCKDYLETHVQPSKI